MGKKPKRVLGVGLLIIMTVILQLSIYAADNRNTTGYHLNRNDRCIITHTSTDLTDQFWSDQVLTGGNYQWSTFTNSSTYTDSNSVNTDYGSKETYLCDEHDYNYIDVSKVEFACGKNDLIDFLNNMEGAGLGFDSELMLSHDTNYLPVYTFMSCPLDGLLARLKINYYGFWCDYENCYVITGIRYQTKCSNFGYEDKDAFGNSGWYAGWEFGYGGGYNYPHNHCYGHPNEYTITYDPNGGSGTINDLSCLYNSSYNLSNSGYIRPGWRLSGWKNIEMNQIYSLGQSFTNLTATQGEVFTMSALWEDINPPTINVQNPYGWINQNVEITASAVDYESGMKNLELYDGSTLLTYGEDSLSFPFITDQIKTYRLKASDNAGNTSYRDFTVNIDKTPPDIAVNNNINKDVSIKGENSKVNISVDFAETLSGLSKVSVADSSGNVFLEQNFTSEYQWIKDMQENYIDKVYENLFLRQATTAERQGWVKNQLNNNVEVGGAFWGLFENNEFSNKYINTYSDRDYIYMLFDVLLDREPDGEGFNNYSYALATGSSRNWLGHVLYESREAVNKRASHYGIPISQIYNGDNYNASLDFTVVVEGTSRWYYITATDNAGNSRTQVTTVLINKSRLKVDMPDYSWTNQNVPVHITSSNTSGTTTHYNLYNNDTGAWVESWKNNTDRYYWVTNEGVTHWKCIAYDDAGNYAEATNSVEIDKTAPTINSDNIKATYNPSEKMTSIKVIANDYLSGINTLSFYDSNNQLLNQVKGDGESTCEVKYTFNNIDYEDYYYVIVTDLAGNTYQQIICAKYTANHFKMNYDNKTYGLADADIYLGIIGQNYNPTTKDYIGFNTPSAQSINVTTDGQATINYFYILGKFIVKFNGNGGTGVMFDISDNIPTIPLPTHTYTKENAAGKSQFLGWDTDYKARKPMYMENALITINAGTTELKLYAIWDDCPVISGTDSYYTLEDAKSGKITEADLLKYVLVTDDWDSSSGQVLKVTDYNPYEFKQFTSDGSTLVKYQVTDSAGNTSYTTNTVYIVDTTTKLVQENKNVRFISEDYFQKSTTEGGLGENSIWKTSASYSEILEKAMKNRKSLVEENNFTNVFGIQYSYTKPGSISQNQIYQSWSFNSEEIKKVKEYINTHGIGNIQEATALNTFLIEFSDCKNR